MLKPTVRNLYQFMSVQAELHDPIAAHYYSTMRGNAFLLVKTKGNQFRVDQVMNYGYIIRILKNGDTHAYACIPQFSETRVYKSGIRITY